MPHPSDCRFSRRPRTLGNPVLWIILVAVVLRAAAVVASIGWAQPPSDKTGRYDAIALNLLEGRGFVRQGNEPTAVAPPLYPLLLAGVYGVAGYSETAVRATLAAADVAACLVWMLIASSLFERRISWLTALLYAVCPYFIYMTLTAGSDTLFLLLLAISVLLLMRALDAPTVWGFVLTGAAIGLATLTRAVPLLLPAYLLPFVLLRMRHEPKKGLLCWLLMTVGFAVALAPWTIRNYIHFHRLVPVQTLGGYHVYLATVDDADPELRKERGTGRGRGTVEKDADLYASSLRRIASNPLRFVRGMPERWLEMWTRTHSGRGERIIGAANLLLLVAAAAGVYITRERWRSLLPIFALISYFVLLHTVLIAIFRYMVPVFPGLLMLASVALVGLLGRLGTGFGEQP